MWVCGVGDGLYVSVAVLVGIAEHPSVVEVLQKLFIRFVLFLRVRTLGWGPLQQQPPQSCGTHRRDSDEPPLGAPQQQLQLLIQGGGSS